VSADEHTVPMPRRPEPAPPAALPQIELAILSRPGGREYNEDACGHWHSDNHLCCVVADGAGGHGGGDIAARIAVRHIIERFAATPVDAPEQVRELLLDTNASVIRHRADGDAQANMHTTVVSLFIDLDRLQALWGHAGDSRLYVFRDGQLLAHTRDHSLVQTLVEAGLLTAEQMRNHPRRSELHSALGTEPEDLRVTIIARPWTLVPGDVFLLCTDGLWEYVEDEQMCESLSRASNPSAWLDDLEQRVLHNAELAHKPRHDNFSGVAVWIGQPSRGNGAGHA
jgi:PPM family protein phosphatase